MTVCAVKGCNSNSDKRLKRNKEQCAPGRNVKYFRFPRDEEVRKKWLVRCGKSEDLKTKNLFVCSKHFLQDQYVRNLQYELLNYMPKNAKRLKVGAVPTLNLPFNVNPDPSQAPAITDVQNVSETILPSIAKPATSNLEIAKSATSNLEIAKHAISTPEIRTAANTGPDKKVVLCFVVPKPTVAAEPSAASNRDLSKTSSQSAKPAAPNVIPFLERELNEAMKNIQSLTAENKKLTKENYYLKQELKWIETLFTSGQRRKMQFNKRVKWNLNDIAQAVTLYASGSKAYKLLINRGYPLPAVLTLRRWAAKLDIDPGHLTCVLTLMKHANLSSFQRVCLLMVDEMQIRRAFEYDTKNDTLLAPASCVQVVMARGLFKNWKQPVYFDCDPKSTKQTLTDIITKLHEIQYNVVAVVLGLEGGRELWREMRLCETEPYFTNPSDQNKKVYVFCDTLHLVKLLREHFLKSGIMVDGKLLTKEPLEELLAQHSHPKLKISSRLKVSHLNAANPSQKDNLKLATQLFSRTNSCALKRLGTIGATQSENWLEVSVLLRQVNDWFDVFNSRVARIESRPRLAAAYGLEMKDQQSVLNEISKIMETMRVGSHESMLPFQRHIMNNTKALKMLFDDLKQHHGAEYILTHRLNQESLETFFRIMKMNDALDEYPTALQFKNRLCSYLLGQGEFSQTKSDEQDSDSITGSATHEDNDETITYSLLSNLSGRKTLSDEPPEGMSNLKFDTLEYLAGFILNHLKIIASELLQKYSEEECPSSITITDPDMEEEFPRPKLQFLEKLRELQEVFEEDNLSALKVGTNFIKNLLDISNQVDLELEIKQLYFRCKMYFRMKVLNNSLLANVNPRKRKMNKPIS